MWSKRLFFNCQQLLLQLEGQFTSNTFAAEPTVFVRPGNWPVSPFLPGPATEHAIRTLHGSLSLTD